MYRELSNAETAEFYSKRDKSYFPLLIQYNVTKEEVVVKTPEDIRNGEAFVVLQTHYYR
jgi:hypothetical protein